MTAIMDFAHRLDFLRHDVSKTGSISVNRYKVGKFPAQLAPLEKVSVTHWTPNEVIIYFDKVIWNMEKIVVPEVVSYPRGTYDFSDISYSACDQSITKVVRYTKKNQSSI
jgi:hypothetical protein